MCHDQGTVQPPSEKVHQIIARTAIFVSNHGGQSEIVLRVKQGDNPTFGFLMPDHHLHAYFRFLVDHVELLNSGVDAKPLDEKKEESAKNPTCDVAVGALSLLGSVYGSGEDEDGTHQFISESKEKELGETLNADNATISHGSECAESSVGLSGKVGEALKPLLYTAKEKSLLSKRNRSVAADNSDVTCSRKREGESRGSSGVSMEKPQVSTLSSMSKVEPLIMEPPSDLKRMVDKIVEFILKNGKEFEAVLIEQDSKNGRFPFLLPSDQYHPYYLKVLQKAQESKFPGKCFSVPNHNTIGGKKGGLFKDDNDALYKGSSVSDIPFDSERKEKFKMVLGGSKKDAQDLPPKPKQHCGVSVDAAAAILQAATRGLRNPKLDILPKASVDDSSLGLNGEGGPTSSFGSPSSSRGRSSIQKSVPNGEPSSSMPVELSRSAGQSEKEGSRTSGVSVAKAIAKTAALAAASEADSSEASLTKEQKQKVERLKRAKMFAAMIKGGTAPRANDLLPRLSAEPPDSLNSGLLDSGCKASKLNNETLAPDTSNLSGGDVDLLGREREGSSVPIDANTSDRSKSERHDSDDDYKERKLRRKYRSRSKRFEESDNDSDGRDHKHYRKKHRSHHSSSHRKDESKHRKRHSSPDYKASWRRHKHHSSSEDEHKHRHRSEKHRSHSERKMESENDIDTEVPARTKTLRVNDSVGRAATQNSSKDPQDVSNPLATGTLSSDTTEVSDELRAKVRAMLLATM
ncbi:protein suppressor of white apricot isoform X2 [Macadamia integrifolia]|uniref:protein suppressor of white apricot isoform X2 n=1 Tax=Macadamia integrifolia TaxID=60698 RepID=UPI001C528C56|nr:protein suppressor of white apricot isoform X2 [Macadamia integrifolia]XP_042520694.1 protein suppressor of white apricot isoform X2 [Macadamia integrifolia]XP_042520695.1 protein suppressor of white apricot isoform X2 [Macadamia integrifolia]XP_042520696.1 protein suppressor of white apricot isoform X2 [Macadamia integrifolia]XP_042520697.1 protein suppressor of white apricot isoform X2 [Macadamia integrifolia]